jgi:hypothetical protein
VSAPSAPEHSDSGGSRQLPQTRSVAS